MSRIPNLNTLRAARAPASSRGLCLGRARDVLNEESRPAEQTDKDRIVQQTDQDATASRVSAVELGYLDDPFAKDLIAEKPQRRFPIINRGTYARTSAIDRLVEGFLGGPSSSKRKQIISLGAGSDTRYFRLASSFPDIPFVYHELDFPSNTGQKVSAIQRSSSLLPLIKTRQANEDEAVCIDDDGTALYSSTYNLHPIDLRSLHAPKETTTSPATLRNVDTSLPTLLISECCLIYLSPTDADAILRYFTSYLFPPSSPLGLIIYEPINPNDSFGRVMVQNLATRGIVMQTLKRYASLGRQKERMRVMGFTSGQSSADVDFIFENWISDGEKERVSKLEMLDEIEEWKMLAQHYCVAWAWRDAPEKDMEFQHWRDEIAGQPSTE
ncbi:MAG: carboxy methyl transferase for protein phosphatase 2A [Sclerophora amabilis]|nr:MAG: carboxy methyl transferase for protein phosphatase 2A [Sclerophora amabilis]